ncbi:MAG: tetratricopeptide repeat protein [Gammaproteobacteria bacterium]
MLLLAACSRTPVDGPDCAEIQADLRPLLTARWSDVRGADGVAAALLSIRLAIERQLVSHDEWVTVGWCEFRAAALDSSGAAFAEAQQRVRHSTDAQLGLGYVALRQGDPATATSRFSEILGRTPQSNDAAEGLRMAVERLADGDPAATIARSAALKRLASRPGDRDMLYVQASADRKAGGPGEFRRKPDATVAAVRYMARAGEDYLELRQPDGGWQPLFVKGVNIGPALPGRFASEAPEDDATWSEWLGAIASLGANAIRVYTLQPPAFYRALVAHNLAAEQPLWLLQGVWAELPPGDDFDDPGYLANFHAEIAQVIDAVHGDLVLSVPRGHARGVYDMDASGYTLAWIIGREWEPFAVVAYDRMNPGPCQHVGRFVGVRQAGAMECWIGRTLDFAAGYEARRYAQGRPLTFANWPTLDPLHHPTEASRAEEDAWRQAREGIPLPERSAPAWDDDAISVDATLISATDEFAPGVFASYHVYPNFPYFMNLEPAFAEVTDARGVNRYAGYLRALKAHHGRQPVLVAEFGMSTSRGVAHLQPEGLHHGGQHEPEAMRQNARLARSIHAEGLAGGVVFEFMDEWFKSTWSTAPFEVPEDHRPFWFNAESPEQSYGLWANRPAAPFALASGVDWPAIAPLATATGDAAADGWLRLRGLRAAYDPGYVHILLETDGRGAPDWSRQVLALGLDTYAAERGERRLPAPADCAVASGIEFAVVLRGPDDSELLVTPPYRLRHPAESGATDVLMSPLQPTGRFERPALTTNRQRYQRDGTPVAARQVAPGRLRFGALDPHSPAFDTRTDVVIDEAAGTIALRLPWGLLNFGDPSMGQVLHQPEPSGALGTATSDGIRIYACTRDLAAPGRGDSLPETGQIGPALALSGWMIPAYRLEPKHGLEDFAKAFRDLPDTP